MGLFLFFFITSVGIRVQISKIFTLNCLLVCHISASAENKLSPFLKTYYFWQSVYTCSSMVLKKCFHFKKSVLITKVQIIWFSAIFRNEWFLPELVQRKVIERNHWNSQMLKHSLSYLLLFSSLIFNESRLTAAEYHNYYY